MDITVKIESVCPSGGHINITVTKNGTVSKKMTLHKSDFLIEPEEYEEALAILIRSFVKKSGLTKMADIKTAIEGEVFKL